MNLAFKALNDPLRRDILEMLRKNDLTAGEIAAAFHVSWPTVSHHLEILRKADLVTTIKEGQFITYSLNTTVMDEIMKWFVRFTSKKK